MIPSARPALCNAVKLDGVTESFVARLEPDRCAAGRATVHTRAPRSFQPAKLDLYFNVMTLSIFFSEEGGYEERRGPGVGPLEGREEVGDEGSPGVGDGGGLPP